MPLRQVIVLGLSWTASCLQALLGVRLLSTGLWRSYPKFFAYLAALVLESCVLLPTYSSPVLYFRVWVITRPIVLCFESLAVIEIFHHWTANYRGIGRFGDWLFQGLLLVATIIALSTLFIGQLPSGWNLATYVISVVNRAVQLGLAAFMVLMLAFFRKFGGPVPRNVRRHTAAMAAFATANTIGYFLFTTGVIYRLTSYLLPGFAVIALLYWIFALNVSGEERPVAAVTDAEKAQWASAERLNEQLLEFAGSTKRRL